MNRRPVLISGMGAICAAGGSLSAILDSFAHNRRNARPVSLFQTPLTCPVFEAGLETGRANRTLELARHAVADAVADAGFKDGFDGLRVGVCMGTTVACQLNDIGFYAAFRASQPTPMEPVDRFLSGNLAEAIAADLGARGPRLTVVNACSSSADAIGVGRSWLCNDLCDVVVAGGADELNRVPLCGFTALSVMSPELCRPFDRNRKGLNLGEGAGIVILETEEAAARRGFRSDLRLAGTGAASDAFHLTAPRPDGSGLEAAIQRALAEAGIGPGDVAFVNAHGTATRENDRIEGGVLARVFGPGVKALSTKGFTGHTLGAAGALEAVFTAAGLREGWIPASPGFAEKDDEIPLAPVRERTATTGRHAVSTSLAFGGSNTALVIEWTGGTHP
ncbi:MAG: hypothetical protein BWK77_05245 [Verrucomicrobia bacterium A1]|nr:MAG: hypothetical protein BWK77_05245 [Verrucomicrobia bacterium A1]